MQLLLLSNSTNFGSAFLEHAEDMLRGCLPDSVSEVLFIPYAAVRFSFDDFAEKVSERFRSFGCDVRPIHRAPNHGGETRSERLLEFVAANPDVPVIGLREGTALVVDDDQTTLVGDAPAVLFTWGREPREMALGSLEL